MSSSASSTSSTETTTSTQSSSTMSTRRTYLAREQHRGREATDNTALIFTRSTESATRLSRLLCLLSAPIASLITTITKSSSSSSTRKALTDFRQHKIRIIIATDRASRGLDLPDLGHVISYDVPTSMTTYVHRVGRTARAGKAGKAWTLLAHHEARWFWNQIGKGRGEGDSAKIVRTGKVHRCKVNLDQRRVDGTLERYQDALKTLGDEVLGGGGSAAKSG